MQDIDIIIIKTLAAAEGSVVGKINQFMGPTLVLCLHAPASGYANVSVCVSIIRKQRQAFELFGFDLMLDADFKVPVLFSMFVCFLCINFLQIKI